MGKILNDGSVEGKTFSGDKYSGGYPHPKFGKETYHEYRERVSALEEKGFHLGDLSWDDWANFCMGSGSFPGVDSNDLIK